MIHLVDIREKTRKKQPLNEEDMENLRRLLYDEKGMDLAKANFLFDIKENIKKMKNVPPSFKDIFVDAITRFLIEDETSAGKIDKKETQWLKGRLQRGTEYDVYDWSLLENLREKSENLPRSLEPKSKRTKAFEMALYNSRYLTVFAVIGSLVSAVALFLRGAMVVFESIRGFFVDLVAGKVNPSYEKMFEELVSSVDIFLFAQVLIIFAVGVYELFISKIDLISKENDSRPSWLRISSVDDLKSSLGKVILMVLIVAFFKHTLELTKEQWGPITLLYLSIGILLIAAALYLTHKGGHEGENEEEEDEDN